MYLGPLRHRMDEVIRIAATDRALGLLRSLAVYHAIPFRQRRLRRLYARFVSPGDLTFDLGSHVGNRTRALAALGCHVVALEPQPDFARLLRALFKRSATIEVVEAAVSDRIGTAAISVSDRTPTMTTLTGEWLDARTKNPSFFGVRWNRCIDVNVTTLDALIKRFGRLSFIKIDVEGGEPEVLAGLSHRVPTLSFEYLPDALDYTQRCLARLTELGPYRFNWSPGESYELVANEWLTEEALMKALGSSAARLQSGDVYAQLTSGAATGH